MVNMKDSGIEWLGEIPNLWGLSRIGSVYELRNMKVSDKDYPPLSVTNKGIVPQLETAAKTNAHDDRKLVKKGDFAINSRSDRRGSCGISSYEGSVSLINTILAPLGEMNPRYYDWLFHTLQFGDEFYKWGHGIVDDLWTTNWQDMKKITIPMPDLDEQEKIAVFLDAKCSEIDALAMDIQAEIDVLEEYKKSIITEAVTKGLNLDVRMKDSGVKWLEEIPVSWEIKKIKYVAIECSDNGLMNPNLSQFIGLENVIGYSNKIVMTNTEYELSVQKNCHQGNVLFGKLRPYLSKVIIVPYDGFCTGEFLELTKYNGDNRFLRYSLLNKYLIDTISMSTYGAKMPRANSEFIMNCFIAYPTYDEQKEIADYLDKKCAEIDSIIETKKEQLLILDEYKKAIIYEYVTGKKEVI